MNLVNVPEPALLSLLGLVLEVPEVHSNAYAYSKWRLLGVVSMGMTMAFKSFFDGIGKTWVHLVSALIMNVFNVILCWAFIFGNFGMPRMGAPGAGFAAFVSTWIGLGIMIYYGMRERPKFDFLRFDLLSKSLTWDILKLSIPAAAAPSVRAPDESAGGNRHAHDPDAPALDLLSQALGEGASAVLVSRPQLEDGMANDIWSTGTSRRTAGTMSIGFAVFWLIQVAIIIKGTEGIKILESWSAPLLLLGGLALLVWAVRNGGGMGNILSESRRLQQGSTPFWVLFPAALTANVGYWATLSLNIPDFTRYAKSQRSQMTGQSLGLPTTMTAFAFIGVAVTAATIVVFGKAVWDPIQLIAMIGTPASSASARTPCPSP
jgi:hypothetical protein